MKAFVLAAGIGSRLKPWTDSHPKALVEVGGEAMLQRVIDHIVAAGVKDIIVNVHHFASQIEEFLLTQNFDAEITISDERECLLDTGGALRKILPLLGDEPVLVHNADILTTMPLSTIIDAHNRTAADATLLVASRESSRRLVFDTDMCLKGWVDLSTGITKPPKLNVDEIFDHKLSFNGVHILSPSLYDRVAQYALPEYPFSIIDFYMANCRDKVIKGFEIPGDEKWWDVGKPATLDAARQYYS